MTMSFTDFQLQGENLGLVFVLLVILSIGNGENVQS